MFPHRAALPAFDDAGIDAEQIKQPAAGVIDDVVDRFRPVVECRHDRGDHRPDIGERRHRAQMAAVQRRLAHREHQPALFLEHHVGGAGQQRRGHPGRNFAHGADRARRDDHAHGRERARGDRRADIARRIIHRRQRPHVLRLEVGLVDQRHFRRFRHDQMGLDPGLAQHLQDAHAVDRARGAGNADNQPRRSFCHSRPLCLCWVVPRRGAPFQ